MVQAGNPGKSRDVCDHPALFLTNNHAILKCLLASYSTVNVLPKKRVPPSSRKKSRYKPYWSDDLQSACDTVCEKERLWLRCRGSPVLKRRLRDSYNQQRKTFDKMNRCAKRKYQMAEQDRLKDMYNDHDTRNFWKYIGKLGLQNDRKSSIPMEVVDNDGNVNTNIGDVLSRWKNDYTHLFQDNSDVTFDENHLQNIKEALQNNNIQRNNVDLTSSNAEITRDEVEKSVMRAKLRKAAGLL